MGDIRIYLGGYHEYRGSTQITKDFFPTVLNTPHDTQDTPPHGTHESPTVLSTSHGTEHTLYRVIKAGLKIALFIK